MSLLQTLEIVDLISNSINQISNTKIALSNQVDQLLIKLEHPDVLKSISNEELQRCIDVINDAGVVLNRTYPNKIVPYPRPIEFKKYCTNKANPVYTVYQKIMYAATKDLAKFSALYIFSELLWYDVYEVDRVEQSLKYVLSLIPLSSEELQIMQLACDKHYLNINLS
jgi:hypothetical protein